METVKSVFINGMNIASIKSKYCEDAQEQLEEIARTENSPEMQEIIDAVKNSTAIDQAFAFSERYLHKALEIIKPLPRGKAKYALQNVAKYIGKRKF